MLQDSDILIVEDEVELVEILKSLLELEGYIVSTANNVDQAREAMKTHSFSLIISDITMPNKTGLEFLHDMAAEGLIQAVVMLTAYSDPGTILQAMRLGAIDFVSKPFDFPDILERLPGWVELGKRMKELYNSNNAQMDFIKAWKTFQQFRAKSNKVAQKKITT